MKTPSDSYLIGQLAKAVGVKTDTVRFYEKSGLLPRTERTAAAYRVYDEAALRRLRFIKQAQSLGFSLDEIKRILGLRGQGSETCRCVIAIAEATLSETGQKLRELQEFHDRLKCALTAWKQSAARRRRSRAEFCELIERLPDGSGGTPHPEKKVKKALDPLAG
jgi:DNA-binding transcriptional MerR regulator